MAEFAVVAAPLLPKSPTLYLVSGCPKSSTLYLVSACPKSSTLYVVSACPPIVNITEDSSRDGSRLPLSLLTRGGRGAISMGGGESGRSGGKGGGSGGGVTTMTVGDKDTFFLVEARRLMRPKEKRRPLP
jgi:hypothetical protein